MGVIIISSMRHTLPKHETNSFQYGLNDKIMFKIPSSIWNICSSLSMPNTSPSHPYTTSLIGDEVGFGRYQDETIVATLRQTTSTQHQSLLWLPWKKLVCMKIQSSSSTATTMEFSIPVIQLWHLWSIKILRHGLVTTTPCYRVPYMVVIPGMEKEKSLIPLADKSICCQPWSICGIDSKVPPSRARPPLTSAPANRGLLNQLCNTRSLHKL